MGNDKKTKFNIGIFNEWQFWLIAILLCFIILAVIFSVLICFNCFQALKCDNNAKILWITFLCAIITAFASLIVGIVAFWQNTRNEYKLNKQYELNKINGVREKIYQNSIMFARNNALISALIKQAEILAYNNQKMNIDKKILTNLDMLLLDLSNLCEMQANDIYNIRYNFNKLKELHTALCGLITKLSFIVGTDYAQSEYQKLIDCNKDYINIRDLYSEVIIDIDNEIEILSNRKISYTEFCKAVHSLKNLNEKNKTIKDNISKLYKQVNLKK